MFGQFVCFGNGFNTNFIVTMMTTIYHAWTVCVSWKCFLLSQRSQPLFMLGQFVFLENGFCLAFIITMITHISHALAACVFRPREGRGTVITKSNMPLLLKWMFCASKFLTLDVFFVIFLWLADIRTFLCAPLAVSPSEARVTSIKSRTRKMVSKCFISAGSGSEVKRPGPVRSRAACTPLVKGLK